MLGGAAIDRRAVVFDILRDIVEPPSRAPDLIPRSRWPRSQAAVHHQPVAVLHQHMAQVVELRFPVLALAEQLRLRVRGRGMGLVAALLAVEIAVGVAAAARRRFIRAILPANALQRGPSLDQRAVHSVMLVAGQPLGFSLRHNGGKEAPGDVRLQQPDQPQRMPLWEPTLRRHITEQAKHLRPASNTILLLSSWHRELYLGSTS